MFEKIKNMDDGDSLIVSQGDYGKGEKIDQNWQLDWIEKELSFKCNCGSNKFMFSIGERRGICADCHVAWEFPKGASER